MLDGAPVSRDSWYEVQTIADWGAGCYAGYMTTKQQVLQAVQDLPEDATFEDAMERLLFLAKIERGVQQADAGQTIPHNQVKERMAKWLK